MKRIRIREIRERMGLTQEEFASQLPVSPRTVSRWETDEASPSPLAIARVREMERVAKAEQSTLPAGKGESHEEPRRRGSVPVASILTE